MAVIRPDRTAPLPHHKYTPNNSDVQHIFELRSTLFQRNTFTVSVNVRHVHCGEIRIIHAGRLSRRIHVHQRVAVTRDWRPVVWQCMGLYGLLQRNSVDKPHSHALQTLRTGNTRTRF